MTESELQRQYEPYNSMKEFQEGWNDYYRLTYHKHSGAAAQAYQFGQEAAMRWNRIERRKWLID